MRGLRHGVHGPAAVPAILASRLLPRCPVAAPARGCDTRGRPDEVQPFAVDTGVHVGPRAAARQLQEAVGATVDGVVGPKTLLAVELAVAVGGGLLVDLVRIRLDAYARQIRRSVTNHDRELRRLIEEATSLDELRLSTAAIGTVGRATKLRFIRGWIARAAEVPPVIVPGAPTPEDGLTGQPKRGSAGRVTAV